MSILHNEKTINIPTLEDHNYLLFAEDFNPESTGSAIRFILERNLMKTKPDEIKMIINSPGGEISSAFALIDTMKSSKVPIYTYGLGEIASCGLMTFIAGEHGNRYITKNTAILSHQFSWGVSGKEHELAATAKEFKNTRKRIIEHYKKCTGLSEKEVNEFLLPAQDVWLTAKEAIKLGIADAIVSSF